MEVAAPQWILDDGPFDAICRTIDVSVICSWPNGVFAVAPTTAASAVSSPPRQNVLNHGQAVIKVLEISVMSPVGQVIYEHFRKETETLSDLAEHESIAWILVNETDSIFVTQDKSAAVLALSELGRHRVEHPFGLWEWLWKERLIKQEHMNRLCQWTLKSDQRLPGRPWRMHRIGIAQS